MTGWLTDSKEQKRYFEPSTGFMKTGMADIEGKEILFLQ